MREQALKLVVLGADGVGKTALTVKFLTQRFIGEYSSRKDHVYKSAVVIDGMMTNLEILDTSKYSNPDKVRDLCGWGHGFLVVFSVSDQSSLYLAKMSLQILSKARPRPPTILIAQKSDLQHTRRVGTRTGLEIAVQEGSLYLEVSAAGDSTGSQLAFTSLARLIQGTRYSIKSSSCISLTSLVQRIIKRKNKRVFDMKNKRAITI